MTRYPIGIQSFEEMINGNYLYIDKTKVIHRLVTDGKYYFLSRPRRFGKSLLVSTLEAYFLGKKDLFKGLAMEQLETEWTQYPVFHVDMSLSDDQQVAKPEEYLNNLLEGWENVYGKVPSETTFALRFAGVIKRACEQCGRQVVILVDEYDKPLLDAIDDAEAHAQIRSLIKSFLGVIKPMGQYIRFALITGVSRFSRVSIFSDLNNLNDITMSRKYETICGITDDEIDTTCRDSVQQLADFYHVSYERMREQLRNYYDGYHFVYPGTAMYNPFSLFRCLDEQVLDRYWFDSGTPTFLVKLMKSNQWYLENISGATISSTNLNVIDSYERNPLPLFVQDGYLTIVDYNREDDEYTLDFPNEEVRKGFINFIWSYYIPAQVNNTPFDIKYFRTAIRQGDPEEFMRLMQAMFASVDYSLSAGHEEVYFQNVMYIFAMFLGLSVTVERHTSHGRIDMDIITDKYVYLFEFKVDETAQKALQQINEKDYAAPFVTTGKTIYKIGVNFSSATRTITDWLIE